MEDTKGAIYTPPKGGLPFLVVTFEDGDFKAKPAKTRAEARALLARSVRSGAASETKVAVPAGQ